MNLPAELDVLIALTIHVRLLGHQRGLKHYPRSTPFSCCLIWVMLNLPSYNRLVQSGEVWLWSLALGTYCCWIQKISSLDHMTLSLLQNHQPGGRVPPSSTDRENTAHFSHFLSQTSEGGFTHTTHTLLLQAKTKLEQTYQLMDDSVTTPGVHTS